MSVFRLDPISTVDPSWAASSIRELLFVGADSPSEARDLAAQKTGA